MLTRLNYGDDFIIYTNESLYCKPEVNITH